jgi:hypothetical protein
MILNSHSFRLNHTTRDLEDETERQNEKKIKLPSPPSPAASYSVPAFSGRIM